MEEISSVRQHTIMEIPAGHNRNPPVLVHCCTGIGRTAVTILSDLLLYTLDHNQVSTKTSHIIIFIKLSLDLVLKKK